MNTNDTGPPIVGNGPLSHWSRSQARGPTVAASA
jgi:hypothetical protein